MSWQFKLLVEKNLFLVLMKKIRKEKALLYLHSKINDDVEVVYITEEEETPEIIEKFLSANKTIAVIQSMKVLRTINNSVK